MPSGMISELEMRASRLLKFEISNTIEVDTATEAEFSCKLGHNMYTSEDDDYFYARVTMLLTCAAANKDKTSDTDILYEIAHESACELRQKKKTSDELHDFIELAEPAGLTALISAARAQIQGTIGLLGLSPPFHLPLLNAMNIVQARQKKETALREGRLSEE